MRVIAIDYGDARTGIAISDITASLVGEVRTIKSTGMKKLVPEIAELVKSLGIDRIVVGYPKNMSGTVGPRAEISERLARELSAATGLQAELWDERLTTVDAHRILAETGHSGKKRRGIVDSVAAALILEGYLGSLNR